MVAFKVEAQCKNYHESCVPDNCCAGLACIQYSLGLYRCEHDPCGVVTKPCDSTFDSTEQDDCCNGLKCHDSTCVDCEDHVGHACDSSFPCCAPLRCHEGTCADCEDHAGHACDSTFPCCPGSGLTCNGGQCVWAIKLSTAVKMLDYIYYDWAIIIWSFLPNCVAFVAQ